MSQALARYRVSSYRSEELAYAVMSALREALDGADALLSIEGEGSEQWAAAARSSGLLLSEPDGAIDEVHRDRVILVCSPEASGLEAVDSLVGRATAVVLATWSPLVSGVPGPEVWADRFAAHRWRFSDVIRPALWDDERFGPDVKEGWLCFVAPGRLARLGASAPTRLVHPDRLAEADRFLRGQLTELREQFLDKLQPLAHRRELDVARRGLADAVETIDAQRQQLAALEARVAANERRLVQLMEQQLGLGGPLVAPVEAVAPGPRPRRRKLLAFITAQPAARTAAPAAVPDLSPALVALFDAGAYVVEHPDAAVHPLTHYLTKGEALGYRPNAWFDPLFYRERYPDVARAGVSPLAHFADYGGAEGRAASAEFDTEWYVATYPEVRRSGLNPLLHYLAVGAALGYRTRAQALPGEGGKA